MPNLNDNDHLLLKVSVIEHREPGSSLCRTAEDIVSIVCDPPSAALTPTPTVTITPSPTPPINYDSNIPLTGSATTYSTASQYGITFSSFGTNIVYFQRNSMVSPTMSTLSIRKGNSTSSVEIGRLVFLDSYMNTPLKMLLEGNIYYLNFITGTYYIN
jgi:hypothetical protein